MPAPMALAYLGAVDDALRDSIPPRRAGARDRGAVCRAGRRRPMEPVAGGPGRGIERAIDEARLLAAQVDDHIGNLENLMAGLSRAVSTDPADTAANDALLRQIKTKLPDFVGNIVLYVLDGTNIGTSASLEARPPYAGDRAVFPEHIGRPAPRDRRGRPHAPIGQWVITVARPVEDRDGRLRAVLAVGTQLEHFQDALRIHELPPGSVVRIVNETGIVVAQNENGPTGSAATSRGVEHVAGIIAAKEASEVAAWPDDVERITGSSTAHAAPGWCRSACPTDVAFATVVVAPALGRAARRQRAADRGIRHRLDAVGRIVRPLRQLETGCFRRSPPASSAIAPPCARRDEVGVLADTFNRMAACARAPPGRGCSAAVEMRQAKDTLAAVIDASPVAIVCSDLDRRIVLWSRAAEQIFGYTAEETHRHADQARAARTGHAESQALFQRAMQRRDASATCRCKRAAQGRLLRRHQDRGRADVPSRRHRARRRLGLRGHHRPQARRGAASSASPTTISSPACPTGCRLQKELGAAAGRRQRQRRPRSRCSTSTASRT